MLSAKEIWCHIALQEREVKAVEKLGRLGLIPRSTRLSLQIAYLKTSSSALKALLKARGHLQTHSK